MLNRKRPESINTDLTISGLGDKFTVNVTYRNVTQDEWDELMTTKKADGTAYTNAEFLERTVLKFNDTEKPTAEDFAAVNNEWPGILFALIRGFSDARVVNLEKN